MLFSPVFAREVKALESNFSDKKKRFDSSLILGAAKKCKFNHVQVITCSPIAKKLRPFPTSFWLTCPYLIKLAGKIESQCGIMKLEKFLLDNNLFHEWNQYNLLHQLIRVNLLDKKLQEFLRKYKSSLYKSLMRGGVGGTKYFFSEINIKCLHLQTASFLALNYHPAGEWLKSQGLQSECNNCQCSRL